MLPSLANPWPMTFTFNPWRAMWTVNHTLATNQGWRSVQRIDMKYKWTDGRDHLPCQIMLSVNTCTVHSADMAFGDLTVTNGYWLIPVIVKSCVSSGREQTGNDHEKCLVTLKNHEFWWIFSCMLVEVVLPWWIFAVTMRVIVRHFCCSVRQRYP